MTKADFTPIPSSLIDAISAAYRDSDSTLSRRVKVIRRALDAGYTVKQITESMAAAATVNPEITAVTATIYGYAAAAARVLISLDMASSDATADQLATLARAAKHVGVGPFNTAVRATLAPLTDAVTPADKLEAVVTMAADALANVRPDRARAAARAARPNMGTGDTDAADIPNTEDAHPMPATGKPDAVEVLAALRRATKYLRQGSEVDPIMASAISEFVAAAAAASRRIPAAA